MENSLHADHAPKYMQIAIHVLQLNKDLQDVLIAQLRMHFLLTMDKVSVLLVKALFLNVKPVNLMNLLIFGHNVLNATPISTYSPP